MLFRCLSTAMWSYYMWLFRGQRVTSEVVENETGSSASDSTDEVQVQQLHPMSTSTLDSEISSVSCPPGAQEGVREEGTTPDLNSQCIEVKLLAQCSETTIDDHCKVELSVVEGHDCAECSNPNTVIGVSALQSQVSENSGNKSNNANLRTQQLKHLQHNDITVSVTSPSLQWNPPDLCKIQDRVFPRTVSTISTDSQAESCRICQQPTDEPLIELGCHCRGDLAKAHRTCIQRWFDNKGTNRCEVCRHMAINLRAPTTQPLQKFWAWRLSHRYPEAFRQWQRRARFHPLLAALLILVAGLLFDILISYYLGASALPVNIIIGVLVILGLGTATRLIVECCHERNIRRSIQRMEMAADMELNNSRL